MEHQDGACCLVAALARAEAFCSDAGAGLNAGLAFGSCDVCVCAGGHADWQDGVQQQRHSVLLLMAAVMRVRAGRPDGVQQRKHRRGAVRLQLRLRQLHC